MNKTYTLRTHYSMFSLVGNAKVRSLVAGVRKALEVGMITETHEVRNAVYKGMDKIQISHPEVWDTAVREAVWSDVFAICELHGISEDSFFTPEAMKYAR
jgi:hypothetical protein